MSQQFSLFSGSPTEAFRQWQNKIPYAYKDGVIRPLEEIGMQIEDKSTEALIGLSYLSSLIPKAQMAHKAIFELSGSEARGAHFKRSKNA